jgi:hypothetical protein
MMVVAIELLKADAYSHKNFGTLHFYASTSYNTSVRITYFADGLAI